MATVKFHLTHIIPNRHLHIAYGYTEIVETVQWGLAQLGHEVTCAINRGRNDATNIVFGATMLGVPVLHALPDTTIIYNLEQMAGLAPIDVNERVRYCAQRFAIWDYSEFNLPAWSALDPHASVSHVPIGYAPVLARIAKPATQDIDVLFYGGPGGDRLRVFAELCDRLLKAVFVHGLYGSGRDELIARSKIVLNITQYPLMHVFEAARVSYLLANRKCVVSDDSPSLKIEDDLRGAVKLVPPQQVVEECVRLIENDAERAALEETGFECIARRDIRTILARVL